VCACYQQSRVDALTHKKQDFLSDISKFKKFAATMQDQKDAVMAAIAELNSTVEAERTFDRSLSLRRDHSRNN
jgi:hypothetical protein